jgi:hypothetical protein
MALDAWALLSLPELKEHLGINGTGQDTVLESVIMDTTEALEDYLDRDIVTRATLVEYHTMTVDGRDLFTCELRQRQWPIIAITSVYEDTASWPRTYPASTLLTVDVDYQKVRTQRDFIRRLNTGWGSAARIWGTGIRAIKLTYTGGYATTATVPRSIKTQAKKYAALLWREIDRKMQGVSSQSDALGNFQRFGPATITKEMEDALSTERRPELFETGEAA